MKDKEEKWGDVEIRRMPQEWAGVGEQVQNIKNVARESGVGKEAVWGINWDSVTQTCLTSWATWQKHRE